MTLISFGTSLKRQAAHPYVFLVGLAALACLGYLAASYFSPGLGFPLDDAWIHQTYARNLALRGEWAFLPGEPSAGSTAPLWSVLLAPGFWLAETPLWWAYGIGWVLLSFLGITVFIGVNIVLPENSPRRGVYPSFLIGAWIVLEWHLAWASVSGMETLFLAWIALVLLLWLQIPNPPWKILGVLVGVGVWVRPDALTLLGPVLLVAWAKTLTGQGKPGARVRTGIFHTLQVLLPAGGFIALYLLFNHALSGELLPNTFFAKQAEYAVLRGQPLWKRFFDQALLPLVGVGILLLPGFIREMYWAVRARRWEIVAAGAWFLGTLGIYAWRLPVTYQHGRYIIPAMPVFFFLGAVGTLRWLQTEGQRGVKLMLGKAWYLSVTLVALMFYILGAQAYARDVAFIESEMVKTAHWVRENTLPGSLVAAHDIGALGFFSSRPILDLAGLVSPEVIPLIRDEAALRDFLNDRNPDYLVVLAGWYPELESGLTPVYFSQPAGEQAAGVPFMVVYSWPGPQK